MIIVVVAFDLSAVASIGSAVALIIFAMVTIGHLRIAADTGARASILSLALATVGITLVTFIFTTLIQEPASIVTLVGDPRSSASLAGPGLVRTSRAYRRRTPQRPTEGGPA